MLKTFRARLLIYSSLVNLCARRDFLRHSLNSRVCFKAKTPSRERHQSSQQNITGTQLGRWNLVVESQRVRRVERKERERAEWLTLLGFIQLQKITILSHNVQSVLTRVHQIEQRHITQTIMLTIFIGTPLIASVPCNKCTLVRRNCIQIFMLLLLIESGMCVWWQKFPQNKEVTYLWRDTSKKKCVNWQFCNSRGFLQKLFFQRDHP